MAKSPLLEKMQTGKTALGGRVNDPDIVELFAALGFDWFLIDQMFSASDWGTTKNLMRAGAAAGITPVVRVQANPWLGYDHRVGIEVTRAFGIGAQFAMVSHSCNREIEECLMAAEGWHRNTSTVHQIESGDEWVGKNRAVADRSHVIPFAESKGAFDEIEQTLSLPGLKLFYIAMTDASMVLTGSNKPDWSNPVLWKFVDKAVRLAGKNGVTIGANSGHAQTLTEIGQRVKRLHEAGVRFISLQSAQFLFQKAVGEFLSDLKQELRLD